MTSEICTTFLKKPKQTCKKFSSLFFAKFPSTFLMLHVVLQIEKDNDVTTSCRVKPVVKCLANYFSYRKFLHIRAIWKQKTYIIHLLTNNYSTIMHVSRLSINHTETVAVLIAQSLKYQKSPPFQILQLKKKYQKVEINSFSLHASSLSSYLFTTL